MIILILVFLAYVSWAADWYTTEQVKFVELAKILLLSAILLAIEGLK